MNARRFARLHLLLAATLLAGAAWARVHPDAAAVAAPFLKIPAGARGAAMGAFVAVADDASALWWNPAGLAGLTRKEATLVHDESFQDLRHEFAGYAHPLRPGRVVGVSATLLTVKSDLERRSGTGEDDPFVQLTKPEGTFGASDFAAAVSYGHRFQAGWDGGITGKFIRQSVDTVSGISGAVDLGVLYHPEGRRWTVGGSIQNLGPNLSLVSNGFPLPLTARVGGAYRLSRPNLLVALEVDQPLRNYPTLSAGLELGVLKWFRPRAGYRYKWFGNDLGALSGLTAGAGLQYRGASLDYVFQPFGDLGSAHRLSLSFRFGKSL